MRFLQELIYSLFIFFFFKQKTAYEMRISDWSSDVCSSDLADLSSLTTAVVGGAAVPGPLPETWAAKDVALRQIYGMTEAGGLATHTLAKEFREHPATCGSGLIFTKVKLVREDGSAAVQGEQGEAGISGLGVPPGNWKTHTN